MTEDMEEKQMMDEFEEKACKSKEPSPKDKERIEEILNWARENIEIACNCGVCQCEDEMIKAGHECETIKTLRNKLTSLRDEVYEKGFIAGADATGSQAEEVLALKLKEQENEIIKKIAHKEVHCELKGYKVGKREMKKKILELIKELK